VQSPLLAKYFTVYKKYFEKSRKFIINVFFLAN